MPLAVKSLQGVAVEEPLLLAHEKAMIRESIVKAFCLFILHLATCSYLSWWMLYLFAKESFLIYRVNCRMISEWPWRDIHCIYTICYRAEMYICANVVMYPLDQTRLTLSIIFSSNASQCKFVQDFHCIVVYSMLLSYRAYNSLIWCLR